MWQVHIMGPRYSKIKIQQLIEFSCIYNQSEEVDCEDIIRLMGRNRFVQKLIEISKSFSNAPTPKISLFFTNKEIGLRILDLINRKYGRFDDNSNVIPIIMSDITILELIRKAFAVSYTEPIEENVNTDNLELGLFKLIIKTNENLMNYQVKETSSSQNYVAKLLLTNNFSYKDISDYEIKNELQYQLVQAYYFFKLIENEEKYKVILSNFYNRYKITNWHQYIVTLLSIIIATKGENGYFESNLSIDKDKLINKSVLDSISVPIDVERIKYACLDEYDRDGNSDYRIFRDKPLIKLKNGDYAVYSVPFLTYKIFSSLYFDFLAIERTLKTPNISNLFTSEFIEKTLFCGLIKKSINPQIYESYDEDSLKKIYRPKDGELGCPDFYLKNENCVILFECKDIRINAWIKEQRDFELYETTLKNKIVKKTYKEDYENKCHRNCIPRKIGCGQIAGHVANIRNNNFEWDKNIEESVIYPVLVIADNRLLVEGMPTLLASWYKQCIVEEGLNPIREKQLIIMSPLTLLKYQKLFKKNGLHKYFEDYYLSISQPIKDVISSVNISISFDAYMDQYDYKNEDLAKEIYLDIFKNHR